MQRAARARAVPREGGAGAGCRAGSTVSSARSCGAVSSARSCDAAATACPGQTPESGDVIGRRDADIEQERAGASVGVLAVPGRQRRSVRHAGDGERFDDVLPLLVPPHLARVAVDRFLQHRLRRQPMHVKPLLQDLVRVPDDHCRIGAAVPDRQLRPRAAVRGGGAHQVAPRARPGGRGFDTSPRTRP